jgi:hypothetical protein
MSLLNAIWDTTVEHKESLEEEFLSFLHELGYVEGSIFRGPSFQIKVRGKWRNAFQRLFGHAVDDQNLFSCYADLGILDLETSQYAALIEFRLHLDKESESRLATVFEAILDHVQTRPSVFMVTPGHDSGYCIYQLQENRHWRELPAKHFPHYPTLTASFTAARALNQESNQARNLDRFSLTCRLLAGAIGVITLTSIISMRPLTTGQISLLILAAVLLIAPELISFRVASDRTKPKLLRIK